MNDFASLRKSDFDLDYLCISIKSEPFFENLDKLTSEVLVGGWKQKDSHSDILWHTSKPGIAIIGFENGGVHQLQFTSKAFSEPDTFATILRVLKFFDDRQIKATVKRIDVCLNITGATPSELFGNRNLSGNLFRRSGITCSTIGDKSSIYFMSRHYKIRVYHRQKSISYKLSKGKEINLEERNVLRSSLPVSRFEVELRGPHCAEANLSIRTCDDQTQLARKTIAKFLSFNVMIVPESEEVDPLWGWLKEGLVKRNRQKPNVPHELVPLTIDEKLSRLGASLRNQMDKAGFTDGEKIAFFYRLVMKIHTERMAYHSDEIGFLDFDYLLDFYLKHAPQPQAEGRWG